ncbi:hypothetical protein MATL_G00130080 [Megalops atlanticus]|uniref:HORMA domain-containing protein n=1 Tax=Megalops atlanticus TaxID=7932 RepID=A0A9D3PXU4_MEGAT|nr:hypothetical protein MATL_G00130080 [Megalops atlanticus]
MHGCFDALQKKYLRMVVLSIYTDPENPQKVTECYQFKIQYTEKGPQIEFESHNNKKQVAKMGSSDIKRASILLVRKLYMLMQNLGPLPDSVCLNMKLSYYDEVTPQEYQPPGFKEGDSDSMVFQKEPVHLTMGEVVTPFHTLKVDVTTERERLEQVDEEEAICDREKWAMKMKVEDQASMNKCQPIKQDHLPVEKDRKNHHSEANFENSEVQLDNAQFSQVDSLKKTSDMEVAIRRTRSGRIIKSSVQMKDTEVCSINRSRSSPQGNKEMSQFAFPFSQGEAPVPKKRKFSEPKERY